LTDEGDVEAFLGVKVDQFKNGEITMTQPELTNRIIEALGLDDKSTLHNKTPAVGPPLQAYEDAVEREHTRN